jgi:EmrB/QacA subfamily drug resistance transporter
VTTTAAKTTTNSTAVSDRGSSWALSLTAIGQFMVALDALVVSTALSAIRSHFGASVTQLQWTVNAFSLTFAVLMMTASVLGDRFGRRGMFTTGVGLFTLASAACAVAPSIGCLIAARALQGAGAALVAPNGMAMLTTAFPPARRGWAMGILSSVIGLAVLSGPVVGGAITQGLAWQWIFWLNVPIGLALVPLAISRLSESRGQARSADLPGLALVTAGTLGLIWGLVRANSSGWGSPEVIVTLVAGAVFTLAFIAWETRATAPMLPIRLFRSRSFAAGNAVSFLLFASNFSTVFFMAQFQEVALRQRPLEAGLRLLPWTAPLFFVAPRAGALADRIGERPLIIVGLLLQAGGMGWLALSASPHFAYAATIPPMVVSATGIAFAMPAIQRAVVGRVAPTDIGVASGTYNTTRWLGAVFGVAILVTVFGSNGGYASPQAFTNGFGPAIAVAAGLALAGCIVAFALAGRDHAPADAAHPTAAPASTQ